MPTANVCSIVDRTDIENKREINEFHWHDGLVDVVAALVVLGPVAIMMALLILRIRQLWPREVATWIEDGPRQGGDPAGVREPRRPLTPAGAGSMMLPLPEDEEPAPSVPSPAHWPSEQGRGLRAS